MSTVLLATDGSDIAIAAMARGVAILGRDHRFITLAVVPPAFVPTASTSPMDAHPILEDPELEQQVEEAQRAMSDTEIHDLDAALGIHAEHLVETGEPARPSATSPPRSERTSSSSAPTVTDGSSGC